MKLLLFAGHELPIGAVCIVGVPSIGNVGQIATDHVLACLIKTGKAWRIGSIESELLLPMTGYHVFANTKPELCLPCEVWSVGTASERRVVILQRSMCLCGAQGRFSAQLHELLVSTLHSKRVVVLTGASTENIEPSLSQSLFSVASSATAQANLATSFPALQEAATKECHVRSVLPDLQEMHRMASADSEDTAFGNSDHLYDFARAAGAVGSVVGGGELSAAMGGLAVSSLDRDREGVVRSALGALLPRGMTATRTLLEHVLSPPQPGNVLDVLVLGKFCAEGDNRLDGRQLGEFVLRSLQL